MVRLNEALEETMSGRVLDMSMESAMDLEQGFQLSLRDLSHLEYVAVKIIQQEVARKRNADLEEQQSSNKQVNPAAKSWAG